MPAATDDHSRVERRQIAVQGAVQGVGFRPFVYRLATSLGLHGWVRNTGEGVLLDIQGAPAALELFRVRFEAEKPSLARLVGVHIAEYPPEATAPADFRILPSEAGPRLTTVLPDVALCADCRRELLDPRDRRYGYPFIACTHCGPRYSVALALPFDRVNTTMRGFPLCTACAAEYADPADRRFHAQLIACATCGPQLALWDADGRVLAAREAALSLALRHLEDGRIVALKGIGGFQLLVDAQREDAVVRLRRRKCRENKPFALMVPALADVERLCRVDDAERALLESPEAPIVLLRRHAIGDTRLAPAVAPGNPNLGVMLPYSPLHLLLMNAFGRPRVATSGNRAEEPICIDEAEALRRLTGVADVFLVNNRPIVRHVDDSVARVIAGRDMVIRRARGYAPLPITLSGAPPPTLAVGGHLKSTVALTRGAEVVLSQHIGDLDTAVGFETFRRVVADLEQLYELAPRQLSRDQHPDYRSTRYAESRNLGTQAVQHHVAHVLACLADNACEEPCLGVAWDGTGFGPDGTVWGGEWFHLREGCVRRVASLRPFRLPGGERAVLEPGRSALGLLYALYGDAMFARDDLPLLDAFSADDRRVLQTMLERGLNSPYTTSAGRLFDAVSALLAFRGASRFEGEAAMALEYAAMAAPGGDGAPEPAPVAFVPRAAGAGAGAPLCADWGPLVESLLAAQARGVARPVLAARFHTALVEAMVDMARRVGEDCVVLSGGCFQNVLLAEQAITRLQAAGFRPLWHRRVPPNDGGLALGQAVAVARGLVDVE